MNTVLVVVLLGLAAASILLVRLWRRADQTKDLGAVSHQWIAEHRLGTSQDPPR